MLESIKGAYLGVAPSAATTASDAEAVRDVPCYPRFANGFTISFPRFASDFRLGTTRQFS